MSEDYEEKPKRSVSRDYPEKRKRSDIAYDSEKCKPSDEPFSPPYEFSPAAKRIFRLFLGILGIVAACFSCAFCQMLVTGEDDFLEPLNYPLRNFDIPKVQAEFDEIRDRLLSVANDTLLQTEERPVSKWYNCLTGYREYVFGADRSFDDIKADFRNLFANETGWREVNDPNWIFFGSAKADISVDLGHHTFPVTPIPDDWNQYQTVYTLSIGYSDPTYLSCHG